MMIRIVLYAAKRTWPGSKSNFAKINKFVWHQKDGVEWISVRSQALAEGVMIGKLAQLIGAKVRVETVVLQGELDLESQAEPDDVQPDDSTTIND